MDIPYLTTEATEKYSETKTILFPRCFPAAWLVCVGLSGPRSGVTNVVDPAILSQLTTTIICQTVRLLLHTWGPVAMLYRDVHSRTFKFFGTMIKHVPSYSNEMYYFIILYLGGTVLTYCTLPGTVLR